MELGVVAVLLQIAHLMVGKGVHKHSSFTYQRIGRARHSVFYIYCVTFGTLDEKRFITDAAHRAHSYVKGADYDANHVDAELWVAATIYWSLVTSYELVFGPLEDKRADKVYREFSVMATALRVPPGNLPFGLTWIYATLKGPVARIMTIEMLPERIKNKLGMPSTVYTRQMFRIVTEMNRVLVPWMPASVREYPKDYVMKDMRRRMVTGSRL